MATAELPSGWQYFKDKIAGAYERMILGGRYLQRPPASLDVYSYALQIAQSAVLLELAGRQMDRLVALGFPQELRVSEDEYRASLRLPPWARQPAGYFGEADELLLVDPRVSWRRQLVLAGVLENDIRVPDRFENLTRFPDYPYGTWVSDLTRYQHLTPQEAAKLFAKVLKHAPLIELAACYLQFPQVFQRWRIASYGSASDNTLTHPYPLLKRPSSALRVELVTISVPLRPLQQDSLLASGSELIPLGRN